MTLGGSSELQARATRLIAALGGAAPPAVFAHGGDAIEAFDHIARLLEAGDTAIAEILADARDDLIDAYVSTGSGRQKNALASLRGVMEGLFTALYYRDQAISLRLWMQDAGFQMVHSLFEEKHEFFKYYKRLFCDERFKREYPGVSHTAVFGEAERVYTILSAHVHKKTAAARTMTESFEILVERVFRVFLAFMERQEELPVMKFPVPRTFAGTKAGKK